MAVLARARGDSIEAQAAAWAYNAQASWDRAWAAAGPALVVEALSILGAAKLLVPVLTGRLRDSGVVIGPLYSGDTVLVTIGFYASYAEKVHESLEAVHPRGGQAKYLQQPFRAVAQSFATRVGGRIKL